MGDAIDASEDLPVTQETRRRVEGLRPSFVVCKEVGDAPSCAQRWAPEMRVHWEAIEASQLEGADTAISARAADQRNEALGQEISADEEKMYGRLAGSAKERECAACQKSKVLANHDAAEPPALPPVPHPFLYMA